MNLRALIWFVFLLATRSVSAEPCVEATRLTREEIKDILTADSESPKAVIAIVRYEGSQDPTEQCLRSVALQAAWRVREVTVTDSCHESFPKLTSKPKEGDRSVDLTVAGEISSVTLRAPKIIRNDGNPYTNVVHVGAPNYGQKRVLSLSIVQAEFWIDYVVGCGSSTLHGSKPLPAADGELRLGFEVIVPPEHANKPWKVDGHPWFKGYFAAPGEHTVTLDGRPDCSFPKVSETSPGVEFPASCLAQVTQTPVPPPVITALVTARGEIVRSGFGDLALQGGARFRLGGAWSAAAQVGGLYSTSARGFVESASLHWDVVRPLTLGLTAEVVEASIDTVDHDSVWAFGFHPQLQARVALIAGFGAFVAPSWFWIFNEQVRMTSEASFFALGFGIDWRSR